MEFFGTVWALLPPVVAIILALITKEVYSSLFVGVVVGALLIASFNPIEALNNIIAGDNGLVSSECLLAVPASHIQYLVPGGLSMDAPECDGVQNVGFIHAISDEWNAGIFVFLIILGIIVALINAAGSSAAFGRWAAAHVKTRVGAMLATFLLGVLIFIDDYFNCLTVGAVMRPVADNQRISRAKLSYIIDATAAPICMIAPISSWAAAVSSSTPDDFDNGMSGIQLFVHAIPYNFYSLLTIVFVVGIAILGFDYGPMAKSELEAYRKERTGSLGNEKVIESPRASLWDIVIPIVLLIVCSIFAMMYKGGFWDSEADGHHSFTGSFGDTDASVALPWGSIIALVITFIYLLARRVLTFKEATDSIVTGFRSMVPALLILTFALTLKLSTSALGADVFVAGLMEGAASDLFKMLPAIIFLVALGLAFATGTSWGTFAVLIPIVVPIFEDYPTLLVIGISAVLAGAVCGDHISPISDTTIMASAGANVDHVEHVRTQLPYALTVAGISFVTFILAGFIQNWMIVLPIGIVLTIGTLFILRATVGKKSIAEREAYDQAA